MTIEIITGDCRQALAQMSPQSVHCCVTSPPYFGLRDYGVDGQIGLEQTPDDYVAQMVAVFREVRRVLRNDGTLWLNLGDSYAANRSYQVPDNKHRDVGNSQAMKSAEIGLKPKDLIGIPWRVAFALQADGWWLRQDIIWHKPNPMPESVTDRCTKAHEYMFLLSKSERYYYDAESIAEPSVATKATEMDGGAQRNADGSKANSGRDYSWKGSSFSKGKTAVHQLERAQSDESRGRASGNKSHKYVDAYDQSDTEEHRTKAGLMKIADVAFGTRNKRSVWTVATQPFKEAHFATFPPALIEPCILAGCPKDGTVLDPFGGAGTTGLVADRLGRHAVLIELNPQYAQMAERRIHADAPLFAEVAV